MSVQSVPHTATDPAGYYTAVVVIAVPLRIKNTSEKPFLCRPFVHLQVERLHTSLSLCLCFFFFFDFLCECEDEPLEWDREGEHEGWKHAIWTNLFSSQNLIIVCAAHVKPCGKSYSNIIITVTINRKTKQHTAHTCTVDIYTVVYGNMHIWQNWIKHRLSQIPRISWEWPVRRIFPHYIAKNK